MIVSTSTQLFAVTFDSTATFLDLRSFVNEHPGYALSAITPDNFLNLDTVPTGSYINLVCKDFDLRKKISNQLDNKKIPRFSLLHDKSYVAQDANIEPGCLIYPLVSVYPNVTINQDVIVHSLSWVAHQCRIGKGSFISGGVKIAGSTTIGNFVRIGIDSTVHDHIIITSDVTVRSRSIVKENINNPGVYSCHSTNNDLTKVK